jgi:hypothetical protein
MRVTREWWNSVGKRCGPEGYSWNDDQKLVAGLMRSEWKQKGWMAKIIGRQISDEDANAIRQLRGLSKGSPVRKAIMAAWELRTAAPTAAKKSAVEKINLERQAGIILETHSAAEVIELIALLQKELEDGLTALSRDLHDRLADAARWNAIGDDDIPF